tara:strand:- start:2282 stop:2695 length:414 start_codon:yes stop_codon:yes gene_type:complete
MDELNINELLREIEEIVRFVLRKIDLDNSSFSKKIKITLVDEQVVVEMPGYGEFIDSGRKKNGRMPPIKSIVEFIRSRRITSTDLTEEQLAYAIANSIKRDGIKPKPFIEKLTEETFNLVSEHIYNEINKKISKTLT